MSVRENACISSDDPQMESNSHWKHAWLLITLMEPCTPTAPDLHFTDTVPDLHETVRKCVNQGSPTMSEPITSLGQIVYAWRFTMGSLLNYLRDLCQCNSWVFPSIFRLDLTTHRDFLAEFGSSSKCSFLGPTISMSAVLLPNQHVEPCPASSC